MKHIFTHHTDTALGPGFRFLPPRGATDPAQRAANGIRRPGQCADDATHHRPPCAPPAEKAYYALTYYLAQNKSGLDVANDSLIRVAYNYYAKLPEDSLYARCMYYMGVYYSLSDSAGVQAIASKRQHRLRKYKKTRLRYV